MVKSHMIIIANQRIDTAVFNDDACDLLIVESFDQAMLILKKNDNIGVLFAWCSDIRVSFNQLEALCRRHQFRALLLYEKNRRRNIYEHINYINADTPLDSIRMMIAVLCQLHDSEISYQKEMDNINLYNLMFNQAPIGIAVFQNAVEPLADSENLITINKAFETIIGRTKKELVHFSLKDVLHPDDYIKDMALIKKLNNNQINNYTTESRYLRPGNEMIWVSIVAISLRKSSGGHFNYVFLIKDIDARKRMEADLLESEHSKAVIMDNLPGMMYRCDFDPQWTMRYVSQGCYELTGYPAESLLENRDLSFSDIIMPEYRDFIWQKWNTAIRDHIKFKEEYEIVTASGEIKWVWEQGQGIFDEEGKVITLEGLIIDITDRKHTEMKLKYLSDHDQLTGLLNLHSFEEFYINRQNNLSGHQALIMIYIPRLSIVNSTYGNHYSDNLIKAIAVSIEETLSGDYPLFHTYFDRFVVYVSSYHAKNELIALAEKIVYTLKARLAQRTVDFHLGIIEIDQKNDRNPDILIKNLATTVEYSNKREQDLYTFFSEEIATKQRREELIIQQLKEFIYNNDSTDDFYMVYQPIIELQHDQIIGFEGLARLKNDELGFISPGEFIPIIEKSQLIIPLGKKIMQKIFIFATKLVELGYRNIVVSFNVSAIQLLNESFIMDLNSMCNETGVDPHNLVVEITESMFADDYMEMNRKLDQIKNIGFTIAMDDFGTGYSSLAREEELNINYIKIDKYFIDHLKCTTKKAVISDIISMAHKLGHKVVAEGVEELCQKEYLVNNDCDMMQGFLFSKPLSEEKALILLKQTNYAQ